MKRAIQLRNIMTSLGPAYIKLGQALSIRPDLLSPAAMNELQKLCDKVGLPTRPGILKLCCELCCHQLTAQKASILCCSQCATGRHVPQVSCWLVTACEHWPSALRWCPLFSL